jgi:hypothetical protein
MFVCFDLSQVVYIYRPLSHAYFCKFIYSCLRHAVFIYRDLSQVVFIYRGLSHDVFIPFDLSPGLFIFLD